MNVPHNRYPFPAPFNDAVRAERELLKKPASHWEQRGAHATLRLFAQMNQRVPAYKDFLRKHKIRPQSIGTINDFQKLPVLTKDNYLRAYPLSALSWDGRLNNTFYVYASSSGSTGEPFCFPRTALQTDQYALLAEIYLRSQYKIHERSTLYVNCFAMGAWIGGLFTHQAIERLAHRGNYPLHTITPGLVKEEALKAIRKLAPLYDQTIIGGYPPFVKELIEYGISEGVQWEIYNIKFVFSAEGFSEKFRDFLAQAVGQTNVLRGSLNHYGTVDLGTMAYETPFAAFVRRAALRDKKLFFELFANAERLPTLAQYIPEQFFFETHGENLVCSANAGVPLLRYDLKDHGGLLPYDALRSKITAAMPVYTQELVANDIVDTVFNLPFVYLYERSDFAVILYGANIYPEHIRRALEKESCAKFATGKCVIRTIENRTHEPRLEVHIELRQGKKPSASQMQIAQKQIIATLLSDNSEYRSNYTHLPQKMKPRIVLWQFADPTYFLSRGKHKWSR